MARPAFSPPFASEPSRYRDRREAGRRLGERLSSLRDARPVVVALPRGGVPVAYEVAQALRAPLEVFAVRKLGAPQNPEYGIGAVVEDGTAVLDPRAAAALGITQPQLDRIVATESAELARRVTSYRGGRPFPSVAGRAVIVVDDGIATGVTDAAALQALRAGGPARLILAVPVCSPSARERLADLADEIVCLTAPPQFLGVGQWYDNFEQVSDREVLGLLDAANRTQPAITHGSVSIPAGAVTLAGDLRTPPGATGLVVFAHGSGSSRHSPRNVRVAREIERAGLGTLLFDLLTESESRERANVFDIGLLCDRLAAATRWARARPEAAGLPIGYFGASTGAAAALCAAAELPDAVTAVVSRGGRPDLAAERLREVRAPTLLIVGGEDREVLRLNRAAGERLGGPWELAVIRGAGHLFEERGALEAVSRLATRWFVDHLRADARGEA